MAILLHILFSMIMLNILLKRFFSVIMIFISKISKISKILLSYDKIFWIFWCAVIFLLL